MTGLNILNYCDRYLPSACKDYIKSELQLSNVQTSIPLTCFVIIYIVTAPLFTVLHDKYKVKRKYIICVSAIIWSCMTICSGLSDTYMTYLITRSLVGLGEAGFVTISSSAICDLYSIKYRTAALTLYYIGIPFGSACGFIIGSYMSQYYTWRDSFMLCGGPGVILGITVLCIEEPVPGCHDNIHSQLDESINTDIHMRQHGNKNNSTVDHQQANDVYVQLMNVQPAADNAINYDPVELSWYTTIHYLYTNKIWLYCIFGTICCTFGSGGVADWMTVYFTRTYTDTTLSNTGFIIGCITVISGVCGTLTGTYLSNYLYNNTSLQQHTSYMYMSSIALLLSAISTFITISIHNCTVSYITLFIAQYTQWMYTAPINTILLNSVHSSKRNQSVAIQILLIHLLGDAISPSIIGVLNDQTSSLYISLLIVPLIYLCASIIWCVGALVTKHIIIQPTSVIDNDINTK